MQSGCHSTGKKHKWNKKIKIKHFRFQIIPKFSVKISFLKYCKRFIWVMLHFASENCSIEKVSVSSPSSSSEQVKLLATLLS